MARVTEVRAKGKTKTNQSPPTQLISWRFKDLRQELNQFMEATRKKMKRFTKMHTFSSYLIDFKEWVLPTTQPLRKKSIGIKPMPPLKAQKSLL